MSGGRVLRGAIRAQVAIGVEWRVHVKTVEARVTEFEVLFTAREAYMQEEIARALAREREVWQRNKEVQAATMDRERS